jgi:hypothetical protein
MSSGLAATLALATLLGGGAEAACVAPDAGSARAPLVSPPIVYRVSGAGRLPISSAPSPGCTTPGVFVVPGDELAVYALTPDGWASVLYLGGGHDTLGWVRAGRLKSTGAALGPK